MKWLLGFIWAMATIYLAFWWRSIGESPFMTSSWKFWVFFGVPYILILLWILWSIRK